MPFSTEAERRAEGLQRELDREREAHEKTAEARARLERELETSRRELERARKEADRLRPKWQPPMGWLRIPVLLAAALVMLAVGVGVGAVLRTIRSEARADALEEERDVLRRAVQRDATERRAAQAEAAEATDVGCLSACGCRDGQGCVGEVCREGVSPAHCCDRPACPTGAPCQHWDGTEDVCR